MPSRFLVVTVNLHLPRWHGVGDWPPSPLRLHQALLAGVCLGRGSAPDQAEIEALAWLESQPPPSILAPFAVPGTRFTMFVPNNDLDSVGGDRARIAEIRDGKRVQPWLLTSPPQFRYFWELGEQDQPPFQALQSAARRLYQLGRGVDPAFADATLLSESEINDLRRSWPSQIWPPAPESELILPCPTSGTLQSLRERHHDFQRRLRSGRLQQPAPAKSVRTGYGRQPQLILFELRAPLATAGFAPWPLRRAHAFVLAVRNALAARLIAALPANESFIRSALIGNGAGERDKLTRIQIIPLPSIGTEHTDTSIRRVLVRYPSASPLDLADLAWGLTGLEIENGSAVLVPADDTRMLSHYGASNDAGNTSESWRTVTPVALPNLHPVPDQQNGSDRAALLQKLSHSLRQAVRHAGIETEVAEVSIQREPWQRRGERAENFAAGPRFHAGRLWHAQVRFTQPIAGPLALGDGRYLGLGVLAPVPNGLPGVLILPLARDSRPLLQHRRIVLTALRRALMSLAASADGSIATLFSGHDDAEGPAASGQHRHIYLLARSNLHNLQFDELLVLAPWSVDRSYRPDFTTQRQFAAVVARLTELRAGAAGLLKLEAPHPPPSDDRIFASSTAWASSSPYTPTRNPKSRKDWPDFASDDLITECQRRHLPRPEVTIRSLSIGPRGGAAVDARLDFPDPVQGPILLGRTAHYGGGLFLPI